MKREDVKNKIPGITDEQLNWLMQENGADINREKSAATALTKATVYEKIVDARTQLSNTYVPTGGRPKGRIARQQPRGSGDSGSTGLFLHLLVDQNAEFLHHVLQRTVNPLHFRDIHNTRGLYALDILLRLGKGCADLRTFFLGNIHNNHHFILKWVAKRVIKAKSTLIFIESTCFSSCRRRGSNPYSVSRKGF